MEEMMSEVNEKSERIIGIKHRVKANAENKLRPTIIYIEDGGKTVLLEMADETSELDFVLGKFPIKWRSAKKNNDLTKIAPHHQVWKKVRKNSKPDENIITKEVKDEMLYLEIPELYDGLKENDIVVAILGGSGDRFTFALSNRGEKIGAKVFRVPPSSIKNYREKIGKEKDDDALTLVEYFKNSPNDFYEVTRKERQLILLIETWRDRSDTMKARLAAEQRLRAHLIGQIFCSEDGQYPEGNVEVWFEKNKLKNPDILALISEEKKKNKFLEKTLEEMSVYTDIFQPIEGVGPMIAARLIVAIGDIRRFPTDAKLKAFLGVHVMNGGKFGDRPREKHFVRRRHGEQANYHPEGRQALYLIADQFNRRPNSIWGKKLLEIKANMREKHPEPIIENGKNFYSNGHIHKMALWRSATKFTEWLWKEWWKLEKASAK